MNNAGFEDIVFIVNMRIRMIRDTLRLNPPPDMFLEKSLDDLAFIDWVLACLTQSLAESEGRYGGYNGYTYISDAEWQFSQLLTEFSLESSLFSSSIYGETRARITMLREASDGRRKAMEESELPSEMAKSEPVVSSAELSGLLEGI